MNEIRNSDPANKSQLIKNTIIVSLIGALIALFVGGWEISLIALVAFAALSLLTDFFDDKYNGWMLNDNLIELKRSSLFGKLVCQTVNYSDIKKIIYFEAQSREPAYIEFRTKKKIYKLLPTKNIFELAGTLKFFQDKNIKVELAYGDHEIELFLQGRIDSVPMTNDMEIRKPN